MDTIQAFIALNGLIEAPKDYVIQVGDYISIENWMGKSIKLVRRVTKTFAIIKHNEHAEGKFRRVYDFWFASVPYNTWDSNTYKVYIKSSPVVEEKENEK